MNVIAAVIVINCVIILGSTTLQDYCTTLQDYDLITTNSFFRIQGKLYTNLFITKDNKKYLWDFNKNQMSDPTYIEANVIPFGRTQFMIKSDCDQTRDECKELLKLNALSLRFSHKNGKNRYKFWRMYFEKVGAEDELGPSASLPGDLAVDGDVEQKSVYNLWPPEWFLQKHLVFAFDHRNQELVYVMNPVAEYDNTSLIRIAVNADQYPMRSNGTANNKVVTDFRVTFVGIFNYESDGKESKIYAVSEKDYELFEITADRKLIKTKMTFRKDLLGCKETAGGGWLVVALVVVAVLAFVLAISCILFCCIRTVVIPNSKKSSTKSQASSGSGASAHSVTRRTRFDTRSEAPTVQTVDSATGLPIRPKPGEDLKNKSQK